MKNYFLLEVGVEELPSRFVESTLTQIKENLEKHNQQVITTRQDDKYYSLQEDLLLL